MRINLAQTNYDPTDIERLKELLCNFNGNKPQEGDILYFIHTIVFDKCNNSKNNMELLDDTPYQFVGSLKPYDYKHFLEIPLENFQLVPMGNGEEDKKRNLAILQNFLHLLHQ